MKIANDMPMSALVKEAMKTATPGNFGDFSIDGKLCRACLVGTIINLVTGTDRVLRCLIVANSNSLGNAFSPSLRSLITNPIQSKEQEIGIGYTNTFSFTQDRLDEDIVHRMSVVLTLVWPTAGHLRRTLKDFKHLGSSFNSSATEVVSEEEE